MAFDRAKFIGKFTQEAGELIEKIGQGLLELEKHPDNQNVIKEIFRAVHTLKGTSKIVRFHKMNQLSHKMEELLMAVQDGKCVLQADMIELLLRSTDTLSQCVEHILQGQEDAGDITPICDVLDAAVAGENLAPLLSQMSVSHQPGVQEALDVETQTSLPVSTRDPEEPSEEPVESNPLLKVEETIRVGVNKLDSAVRLVGELVVSRRRSEHIVANLKDLQRIARLHTKRMEHLYRTFQGGLSQETKQEMLEESLLLARGIEQVFKDSRDDMAMRELTISELYDDVLSMRMLPLSVIFQAFPRAVRDMAKYFHKEIELRITGDETTLDKKIIEHLNGPMIHILRNCVDHGIETPEERRASQKPTTGLLTINASHKSGHIIIEICDDGRGIQRDTLKQRAIQRGILSEEKARTLSDDELLYLVFQPRLSTSDLVTDISGRGVGMDIVKTNIHELKGTVALSSIPGQGTSCVLTLPVTLTTLRCLLISSQHTRFAIPITAIEETIRISPQECIDVVGQQAIRLRNQLIYIVHLADVLGLERMQPHSRECYFVLIARTQQTRVGLIVDDILDEHDVVIKQLPPHLRHAKTIAGATISSDNTITLILHIPEVIERMKQTPDTALQELLGETDIVVPRILVVEDSLNTGEIEKQILEAEGYQVDLARDGINALEHIAQAHYDLVVTDIEMPRMDGFTLTETLRTMPAYADVPIVIVTSLERDSDKKRGLQVGANAYIMKGDFEQRGLLDTIKNFV